MVSNERLCVVVLFPERCARVHWLLPYRWQVLDSDGATWKDLPDMEGIEKAYCDPECDTNCTDQPSLTTLMGFLALQRCMHDFELLIHVSL